MKTKYFRLMRYILLLTLLLTTTVYGVSTPSATDYELMESHPPMIVLVILLIINEGLLIKSGWNED